MTNDEALWRMYSFIVAVGQETLNEQNQESEQQQIPPDALLALPSLLLIVRRFGGWSTWRYDRALEAAGACIAGHLNDPR